MNNKEIGAIGEKKATSFLEKIGYKILDKNYQCKLGEIDIVAQNQEYIVFIEVKSRISLCYGQPKEAVTYGKQKTIIRVAQHYLKRNRLNHHNVRFDVIEVLFLEQKGWIKHIENAFWI